VAARAGILLVDTVSSPTTNKILNKMCQCALIFTTHVFIAMKIATQVNSFCLQFQFFGLEKVSTNQKPALGGRLTRAKGRLSCGRLSRGTVE